MAAPMVFGPLRICLLRRGGKIAGARPPYSSSAMVKVKAK